MEWFVVRLCDDGYVWVTGARGVPQSAHIGSLQSVLDRRYRRMALQGWRKRATAAQHVQHPKEFVVGMIV